MSKYHFLQGDATLPVNKPAIIAHCCNDIGGWGSGFVMALSAIDKGPEEAYRKWSQEGDNFQTGETQIVPFTNDNDVYVANMVAQQGIKNHGNSKPLVEAALQKCLLTVGKWADQHGATVHVPYKMGCDRAGGDWNDVEPMLRQLPVDVYVYQLQ